MPISLLVLHAVNHISLLEAVTYIGFVLGWVHCSLVARIMYPLKFMLTPLLTVGVSLVFCGEMKRNVYLERFYFVPGIF